MSEFVWHPPDQLVESANVTRFMRTHGIDDVDTLLRRSVEEPAWYWPAIIEDLGIRFDRKFHTVFDVRRGFPWTGWFLGGKLNITTNCIDRHRSGVNADRLALIAEHEDGSMKSYTYFELAEAVDRCATAMQVAKIKAGDRVGAVMPMCAEVVIQMFATMKLGAIFIPIFSGFAAPAISERLKDAGAKMLFTAEGSGRRGSPLRLRPTFQEVAETVKSLDTVVVLGRGEPPPMARLKNEIPWQSFLATAADAEPAKTASMNSMDPALILYTSGTTGAAKGTIHSHAGSLVNIAKEVAYAFDVKKEDRFFWLSDIGWMMGPWELIGGMFLGSTLYIYEGAFDWPHPDRLGEMVAKSHISVLGISPTVARLLRRAGDDVLDQHDLSSLRILGSTGEPWDEESWTWFFEKVGGKRCPVINISGGTDLIGCFLSPLPLHPLKPCSLAAPGLGMAVDVWDEDGNSIQGEVGYLVCKQPSPSMTRGLWNDAKRYLDTYWKRWRDTWNHGDWALIDEDGQWFLQGRADDTLNIAGKRVGPAEVEGALIESGHVSEAAAVGVPDELKGEAIVAFAVLNPDVQPSDGLREELIAGVGEKMGKHGRPKKILFVDDLPKTRSAKILRRVVRAKYLGEEDLGDLSSLQNPDAVEAIASAV
ncbi:MAG: AMP-binding protein [Thermoanaerobaculia bacterium]